jgi:hypothetical protein
MTIGDEAAVAAAGAAIALTLATLTLVIVAICQLISASKSQREATAKGIYRDYLKLALEHPSFANPRHFTDDLISLHQNERYRWFIAFMLNACDEIARSQHRNKGWRKTIRLDLEMQAAYLESEQFQQDGGWELYSEDLRGIAREALGKII